MSIASRAKSNCIRLVVTILKVSIPTLNKLAAQGKFNKYHITDCKRVFYKKQEIIEALQVIDPEEITRRKLLKIILKDGND